MKHCLQHIIDNKIIAILRRPKKEDALLMVDALYQGGVSTIEITADTEDIISLIATIKAKYENAIVIGVGTVLNQERIVQYYEAGASFILSPNIQEEVIKEAKRLNMVAIPGALTPTEIVHAYNLGADIVKVFPINTLGASYIKDIQAPLPHIPLLPTGGITEDNMADYLKTGSAGFGISSGLKTNCVNCSTEQLQEITATAKKLVALCNEVAYE
ncbi:bifunctional 4-hydroxy-2-oxoglutarate aldolase/2-dehydro-3-deoxy-phosphogluconate aldolase [Lysinibacillus piscis]|uniref:KHG-KDPG bifunctional aldolase n=1 Tax=Lysinibacillus piscis TaxID=2518931 RepID=A0ABQ5NPV9_9BACI|nr:bifunctional 4-hydroxy-2-oxoglutarate aldolase/2-dehydro-3-deoxy-phosphogluconate aldolase [Lysinibacillus sp. KH24]GLC90358.1 KHG-KDPG bifunctional aldolase [Lysinibacillus sp. KH24]